MLTVEEQHQLIDEIKDDLSNPQSSFYRECTVYTEVECLLEDALLVRAGNAPLNAAPTCRTMKKIQRLVQMIVKVVSEAGWLD